jgi:hypothetical protein
MLGIDQPILITGAARSGTSMVAGMIERCGAFGGQTCGPTSANRKGQYENVPIRNRVIKAYLKEIGADPLGQHPLPDMEKVRGAACRDLKEKVLVIMSQQGLDRDRPWYFKGAKMALMWPQWAAAFPEARWVIVRRNATDIVRSCMNTGFMRKRFNLKQWLEWVQFHEVRFREMAAEIPYCREIWPSRFVAGDFSDLRVLVEWLELRWRPKAVRQFVDPSLWHHDSSSQEA